MSGDEFRSGDPYGDVRGMAADLDQRWPGMHEEPKAPGPRRTADGRFARKVESEFGPIAAGIVQRDTSYLPPDYGPVARSDWQPFSSGEDAHEAAFTREQRAAEMRNSDLRTVVGQLRDTHDVRQAHTLLLLSVWAQCQMLGVQGPTLVVGVG